MVCSEPRVLPCKPGPPNPHRFFGQATQGAAHDVRPQIKAHHSWATKPACIQCVRRKEAETWCETFRLCHIQAVTPHH